MISKTSLFVLICTLAIAIYLSIPPQHTIPDEIANEPNTSPIIPTGEMDSNDLPDLTLHSFRIYGEEGRIIKNMNNKISVTVSNRGNASARNVKVSLYIKYREGENLVYASNEVIIYLDARDEKRIEMTLFSPTVREAAVALLKFAGIEKMVFRVDPNNRIEENNEENNVLYEDISYKDIFPRFARFEERIIGRDESLIKRALELLEEGSLFS